MASRSDGGVIHKIKETRKFDHVLAKGICEQIRFFNGNVDKAEIAVSHTINPVVESALAHVEKPGTRTRIWVRIKEGDLEIDSREALIVHDGGKTARDKKQINRHLRHLLHLLLEQYCVERKLSYSPKYKQVANSIASQFRRVLLNQKYGRIENFNIVEVSINER